MSFLAILVVTIGFVVVLKNKIKNAPVLFYAICLVLSALSIAYNCNILPKEMGSALVLPLQRGGLGTALFVIVMFIGVFSVDGKVSNCMRPVRAELSIMACLLMIGHVVIYLSAYLPNVMKGLVLKGNVAVSFVLAIFLLILLILLGGTSLRFVKKRIRAENWIRLQKLSYLFYALVFLHLTFMLAPSALQGNAIAIGNMIVYIAVFGSYTIARIVRFRIDKYDDVETNQNNFDQGLLNYPHQSNS